MSELDSRPLNPVAFSYLLYQYDVIDIFLMIYSRLCPKFRKFLKRHDTEDLVKITFYTSQFIEENCGKSVPIEIDHLKDVLMAIDEFFEIESAGICSIEQTRQCAESSWEIRHDDTVLYPMVDIVQTLIKFSKKRSAVPR